MDFSFKVVFLFGLVLFTLPSKNASSRMNASEQYFSRILKNEAELCFNDGLVRSDFDFSKSFYELFHDDMKTYFLEHYPYENVFKECTYSLVKYFNALEEWTPWAVRMFDATAKFPDGFMAGAYTEFGSFDDCLEIEVKAEDPFKGRYCTVQLEFPVVNPMYLKTPSGRKYVDAYGRPPDWIKHILEGEIVQARAGWYFGICIPSTCTEQDLFNIVHSVTKPANPEVGILNCQTSDEKEWETSSKIATFILALLIAFICYATVLDLSDRQKLKSKPFFKKSFGKEMVKTFSLYTNTADLFRIKENDVGVVHLVKVILCLWVILAHNIIYPLSFREMRYTQLSNMFVLTDWKVAILDNSFFVVDVFFILGGMLLAFTAMQEIEKTGKFRILHNLFKKFVRLTPAHLFLIVALFAMPSLSSGPVWQETWGLETEKCIKYGWKNLFYIHNFRGNEGMCLIHTWYIAVTMQHLAVLFPLIALTYKYPKTGVSIIASLVIGCCVRDFMKSWEIEYPFYNFHVIRTCEMARVFSRELYFPPYHHLAPHVIGILVGYLIYKHKEIKIEKTYYKLAWIVAVVCWLISEYLVYYPTKDVIIQALYNGTRTFLFGLGTSWFIYAAIISGLRSKEDAKPPAENGLKQTNQKSVPIFSSPKTESKTSEGSSKSKITLAHLAPFSKITYSTYMFHPLILMLRDAVLQERVYFGYISFFVELVLLNMLSFLIGFIGYLAVEQPFNRAYDLWQKWDKLEKPPTTQDGVNSHKNNHKEH